MKTYMRIVIIGLFYFYQFSLANILVSLGGPIQTAFNLKPEQLGWIGSLYFISNVIFLLVAGWLIDTFNARKIVLSILLASIALVLLSALIPNLYVFATSRFLLGICGTFGLIGSFKLCANYVDSKQFATMSGIVITLGMVGSFFISMPFSVLLDYLNWQWALVVVGAIGILIFIAIFLITQANPTQAVEKGAAVSLQERFKLLYQPQILLNGAYLCLVSLPLSLLAALWGVPLLKAQMSISSASAAFAVSMLFVGTLVGSSVVGLLSDHFQKRKIFLYLGSLLSALVFFGMIKTQFQPLWLVSLLFLILGITTSTQGLPFTITLEQNAKNLTGCISAILAMISALGGAVGQPVFGSLLSRLQDTGLSAAESYLKLGYLFIGAFLLTLVITWKIKSK